MNFIKKLYVLCDYFFINNVFLFINMLFLYNLNVIKFGNKILKCFKINIMEDEMFVYLIDKVKK